MNLAQVKDKIKNIHFLKKRRLQSKAPLQFPFLLNVELTNVCSEKCVWCPQGEMTRHQGFMDPDLFKSIIDECSQHEKLRRLYVHWMGEPLLHPKALDLLEYAKKKDVAEMIVIATNGTGMSERTVKGLIELQIDELYVSIDAGTAKTYEELKGTDNFDQIEENIRTTMRLKKEMGAKLPYLKLKCMKIDQNKEEWELFNDKWAPIVDEIFMEEDFRSWDGASEKVNGAVENTDAYKKNYGNLVERYPCDRLWYMLAIQWDGKVSGCVHDWDGKDIVGDLAESSIGEIWYGEKMREFRRDHINGNYGNIDMCRNCTTWGTRNMGDWLTKNKEKALSVPDEIKDCASA